jgi:hypothetical protein
LSEATHDPFVPSSVDAKRILLGLPDGRRTHLALAFALFVLSIPAAALGPLAPQGGVVFVPVNATLLGTFVAAVVGFRKGGILPVWLAVYAPLLGFHADWAFLSLPPSRSLAYQVGYFLEPDGLAVYALIATVFGVVGGTVGLATRYAVEYVRERA